MRCHWGGLGLLRFAVGPTEKRECVALAQPSMVLAQTPLILFQWCLRLSRYSLTKEQVAETRAAVQQLLESRRLEPPQWQTHPLLGE